MAKQTFTTGQVLTAAQMTSLQQTAMGGGSATAKTSSYVLVAADAGTTVAMNAAGATTITVNTALFAAGDTVFIQNLGAGACTVTAGTATVATAGSLILPQNDAGILYFTATGASIFYDYIQVGAASPLTTKGDVYTFSTSDARIGVGANDTVLTADSAQATGLKWATPASGGMTLISTTSLTGASTVLSSITQSYTNLQVQIEGMTNNTANGTFTIYVGIADDLQYIRISDTAVASRGGGENITTVGNVLRTSIENGFNLNIYNYSSSIINHSFDITGSYSSSTALVRMAAFGTNGSAGSANTISSLTFLNTGGNWSAGTVKLWGIK